MTYTERALERAELRTPEGYDGDGWDVALIVGGALDAEWVVPGELVAPYVVARLAQRLAREVGAEVAGAEPVEVWVTHVFVAPELCEATGYGFFPTGCYLPEVVS